jgi:hypothetical protein
VNVFVLRQETARNLSGQHTCTMDLPAESDSCRNPRAQLVFWQRSTDQAVRAVGPIGGSVGSARPGRTPPPRRRPILPSPTSSAQQRSSPRPGLQARAFISASRVNGHLLPRAGALRHLLGTGEPRLGGLSARMAGAEECLSLADWFMRFSPMQMAHHMGRISVQAHLQHSPKASIGL